jgi:hypothetical protein
MSAGGTTSAGARAAVTAAGSPSHAARLVAGAEDRLLPLHLFTAAFLTRDGGVLLAHGTDGFEFLFAGLADIFIDGHGMNLLTRISDDSTAVSSQLNVASFNRHKSHPRIHANLREFADKARITLSTVYPSRRSRVGFACGQALFQPSPSSLFVSCSLPFQVFMISSADRPPK